MTATDAASQPATYTPLVLRQHSQRPTFVPLPAPPPSDPPPAPPSDPEP